MREFNVIEDVLALEERLARTAEFAAGLPPFDTIGALLHALLQDSSQHSTYLGLPTSRAVRDALLTLLDDDGVLRMPLLTLLAQRLGAFIATLRDIRAHPRASTGAQAAAGAFIQIEQLVARFELNYEARKTVRGVADALRDGRLHAYKVTAQEPDIRVVLRAFYEDDRRDDIDSISTLLDYVLHELKQESLQPGRISQPRHAWWGVITLFDEAPKEWLVTNRQHLRRITTALARRSDYKPTRDSDYVSVAPELHSPDNEDCWVAINALRCLTRDRASVFSRSSTKELQSFVRTILARQTGRKNEAMDFKILQSRLILCYEWLSYDQLLAGLRLADELSISISHHKFGKLLYETSVLTASRDVLDVASDLISNPEKCRKFTQSSLILSGIAGTGKSEFVNQWNDALGEKCFALGRRFEALTFAIGRDIKSQDDLGSALEAVLQPRGANSVVSVFFDEFDKAEFDFFTPFLATLEQGPAPSLVFWAFAQSTHATAAQLVQAASSDPTKSRRDFLTRLQLGAVDLPSVRFSPRQRVLTTIGLARSTDSTCRRIHRDLVFDVATRPDITSARDINRLIGTEYVCEGHSLLARQPTLSVPQHLLGRRRARSQWLPIKN